MVLLVFDFKEGTKSPWKFTKEDPRLSLDSKAVVDAKGTMTIRNNDNPSKRERKTTMFHFHKHRCKTNGS